jgi:hypothetical protein
VGFAVSDGRIPDRVERFLRDELLQVVPAFGGGWQLRAVVSRGDGFATYFDLDWPHDREPTLQEAIEAVVSR